MNPSLISDADALAFTRVVEAIAQDAIDRGGRDVDVIVSVPRTSLSSMTVRVQCGLRGVEDSHQFGESANRDGFGVRRAAVRLSRKLRDACGGVAGRPRLPRVSRRRDPFSSHTAELDVTVKAGNMRHAILKLLAVGPRSARSMHGTEPFQHCRHHTWGTRLGPAELEGAGLVERTSMQETRCGNTPANLYRITDKGLQVLDDIDLGRITTWRPEVPA